MSNITPIESLFGALSKREDKFESLNKGALNVLSFEQEVSFARQILTSNDSLFNAVIGNQQSFIDAIYNGASLGISLNPANSHAYLVPRKVGGKLKVCLDVSYRGFLKIATDSGCVKYMKAELVHENDEFEYNGFDQRPTLKTNPFKERGEVIGVYAMAVLHDDSILVENMSIDEIHEIRDSSEAYKNAVKFADPSSNQHYKYKNCVWVKYKGEMTKKTVLKRAFKTLPQSRAKELLEQAAFINNEHEGINFEEKREAKEIEFSHAQSEAYKKCLDDADYVGLVCIIDELSNEAQTQLWDIHEKPLIPQGGKGKYTNQMIEHLKAARTLRDDNVNHLIESINSGDDMGVYELLSECNSFECDFYMQKLNAEQRSFVNSMSLEKAS